MKEIKPGGHASLAPPPPDPPMHRVWLTSPTAVMHTFLVKGRSKTV